MELCVNLMWFFFGGLLLGIVWVLNGVVWCMTIAGRKYGIQCFKMAGVIMLPFGREVTDCECFAPKIIMIIWTLTSGIVLMLISIFIGSILSATVVGIPYGRQYFRFAKIALTPFEIQIV